MARKNKIELTHWIDGNGNKIEVRDAQIKYGNNLTEHQLAWLIAKQTGKAIPKYRRLK